MIEGKVLQTYDNYWVYFRKIINNFFLILFFPVFFVDLINSGNIETGGVAFLPRLIMNGLITLLWAYFLVCLVVGTVKDIKRKK